MLRAIREVYWTRDVGAVKKALFTAQRCRNMHSFKAYDFLSLEKIDYNYAFKI
jgi:hypothetical protein